MLETSKRSARVGSSFLLIAAVALPSCVAETGEAPESEETLAETAAALTCAQCDQNYWAKRQWCLDMYQPPGDNYEDNAAYTACDNTARIEYWACLSSCTAEPPSPPSGPSTPQCTSTSQCISWYGSGWQCNSYGNCEYVSSSIDYGMCKSFGQSCFSSSECCNHYCDWWSGTCGS